MIFTKYLLIITVAALCLAATGNTACGVEKDVKGRLQKAVEEDTAMWQKAQQELPLELADHIMAFLKQ